MVCCVNARKEFSLRGAPEIGTASAGATAKARANDASATADLLNEGPFYLYLRRPGSADSLYVLLNAASMP